MKPIYTLCFILASMFSFAQTTSTHCLSNAANATAGSASNAFSDVSLIYNMSAVQLDWLIKDDKANGYCVVEKSVDGKSWKDIGIAFSGEIAVNEYKFIDTKIERAPVVFYRIRSVMANGSVSFSEVRELNNSAVAGKRSSKGNKS
jgi:hypothetical protein